MRVVSAFSSDQFIRKFSTGTEIITAVRRQIKKLAGDFYTKNLVMEKTAPNEYHHKIFVSFLPKGSPGQKWTEMWCFVDH